MDKNILYTNYLRQGTAGYAIVSRFFFRYADLLARTGLMSVDDILHEVFLSLSKTDINKVNNPQHYFLRAVKLHCWTILDKAIRLKGVMVEKGDHDTAEHQDNRDDRLQQPAKEPEHLAEIEGMELLVKINLFKLQLTAKEKELLNFLIDERERADIADVMEMNLNTLDTNIRRLRIKLAEYLKELGYTYQSLEKFS